MKNKTLLLKEEIGLHSVCNPGSVNYATRGSNSYLLVPRNPMITLGPIYWLKMYPVEKTLPFKMFSTAKRGKFDLTCNSCTIVLMADNSRRLVGTPSYSLDEERGEAHRVKSQKILFLSLIGSQLT